MNTQSATFEQVRLLVEIQLASMADIRLATCADAVQIWQLGDGIVGDELSLSLEATLRSSNHGQHNAKPTCLVWNHNGQVIASSDNRGVITMNHTGGKFQVSS